jgi:release factor glutamine methyltransferase
VEHDDTTAEAVVAILDGTTAFNDVTARRDLTGRPRFVTARRGESSDRGIEAGGQP